MVGIGGNNAAQLYAAAAVSGGALFGCLGRRRSHRPAVSGGARRGVLRPQAVADEAVNLGALVAESGQVAARGGGIEDWTGAGCAERVCQQAEPLAVGSLDLHGLDRVLAAAAGPRPRTQHAGRILQCEEIRQVLAGGSAGHAARHAAVRAMRHRAPRRRVQVQGRDIAVKPDCMHGHDAVPAEYDGRLDRIGAPRLGPGIGGGVIIRLEPAPLARRHV